MVSMVKSPDGLDYLLGVGSVADVLPKRAVNRILKGESRPRRSVRQDREFARTAPNFI
ncbi:hypothetical protein BN873_200008 [Candidatus Competibacter denitrificans Run_A_D11]|uniref:Uncharacterized protein n=1 Tax=Candidatus Competibacter denitrificans Run_A_D11 TaxID=1400863 RepID=W6M7R7_9GAMM|nr:hypothetical protein BN873_200008 [Candidatus Competibacter denitrificans Run_A_D11]